MNPKSFFLSSALLTFGLVPAVAETLQYDHNGSRMMVNWRGKTVTIRYDKPRESLRKHGVGRGTLLFRGKLDKLDNGTPYVDGDARVFKNRCAPVKYYVYGELVRGRDFTLAGAAPVLSKNGCDIVDNTHEGANAKLLFTAVSKRTDNRKTDAPRNQAFGWANVCVTGVQSSLNLRTGPGTDYGRIGELPANACDVTSLNQCINGWCVVQRNIEIGWVSSRYLRAK